MAASVCGTEADVLPTEERKYDHEMSTPLQWEQRAAAWSHQTPRIQNLAKALPLMSKGEEATFKIMVKNLCELAGPEVWRQTVDARQRSVLWHAVDVEDDAAVEILLAYGAGDDERTLQSCRALSHERNMFSIAAQLGAPISEDTFHGNVDESACCHSAMSYQGSENWSLFMRARRVPLFVFRARPWSTPPQVLRAAAGSGVPHAPLPEQRGRGAVALPRPRRRRGLRAPGQQPALHAITACARRLAAAK